MKRPPRSGRSERGAGTSRPRPNDRAGRIELAREPPRELSVEILHGHRAVLAVLARRPGDVRRVGCAAGLEEEIRRGAGFRGDVRVLPPAELARIAGSDLHEGLVAEVAARPYASLAELGDRLVTGAAHGRGTAIALDRVRNPYNVGAILRSAAFFGVDAVLLGAPAPHPGLSPEAVRVAEGGAEHLLVARSTDLAESLARLRRRGVQVVGTHVTDAAPALGFPFARPTVLVLGNEREGMSDRVRAACASCVRIEGSGAVESLNVAVAAGVLVAALTRAR